MTETAPTEFSRPQKWLHWAVVGLLIPQYLVFDGVGRAFNDGLRAGAMTYSTTSIAHIAIGTVVLALAALRLVLRASNGAPPPPADEPPLAALAAKVTHVALYALLFALPLSGLAAWFLQIHDLGDLHEVGTNLLLAVAGLHVAAVIAHQFWWKTGIMRRMI